MILFLFRDGVGWDEMGAVDARGEERVAGAV